MTLKTVSCDYLNATHGVSSESLKVKGKPLHTELLTLTPDEIAKWKSFCAAMTNGIAQGTITGGDEMLTALVSIFQA